MALRLRTPLPDLSGATEWIGGDPIQASDLEGKVTLVHFWAVSCGVCKPHLPEVRDWAKSYGDRVRFVSVHMPRQESDTDVGEVRLIVDEVGLQHPTAVDNTHAITDAFENEFVPGYYVFDEKGQLRLFMSGEKVLPNVRSTIDRLVERAARPE
jgi:thiol-disulfide isomerase/thioredoxin